MDIREKCKEIKKSIEELSLEEKMIKKSIEELKNLISQKKKKEEILKSLKEEEIQLLKELEEIEG